MTTRQYTIRAEDGEVFEVSTEFAKFVYAEGTDDVRRLVFHHRDGALGVYDTEPTGIIIFRGKAQDIRDILGKIFETLAHNKLQPCVSIDVPGLQREIRQADLFKEQT